MEEETRSRGRVEVEVEFDSVDGGIGANGWPSLGSLTLHLSSMLNLDSIHNPCQIFCNAVIPSF
jgi:hypothetical protein